MAQSVILADEFTLPEEAAKPSSAPDLASEFELPSTQSESRSRWDHPAESRPDFIPKQADYAAREAAARARGVVKTTMSEPMIELPQLPQLKGTPDQPLTTVEKVGSVGAGVYNEGAKLVSSLTSPANVAIMMTTGGLASAAKAGSVAARRALVGIGAYFAGTMGKEAVQQIPEAKKTFDDPDASPQEKAAAITAPVLTGAMSLLAALGAVHEIRPDLARVLRDKSPKEAANRLNEEAATATDPAQKAVLEEAAAKIETPEGGQSEKTLSTHEPADPMIAVIKTALADPKTTVQYTVWGPEMSAPGKPRPVDINLLSPDAPKTELTQGNYGSTNLDSIRKAGAYFPNPPESLPPGNYTLEQIREAVAKEANKNDVISEFETPEVGLGSASPKEFKPVQEKVTSLKNAAVDAERVARGASPLMDVARKDNPALWDQAMKVIDENQNAADDIIARLKEKPGAVTDVEQTVLLHREIDLSNQLNKVSRNLAENIGTEDSLTGDRIARARILDELSDLEQVNQSAGTETSRGLNARKLLAKEDFSLASMLTERRADKGGEALTDAEVAETTELHDKIQETQDALDKHEDARLEAAKERLKKSTEELNRKTAAGDFEAKPQREPVVLDEEGLRLKAENYRAKQKFREALLRDRFSQRNFLEKAQDTLVKWRRGFLLSSPVTLAKLSSAAVQRMVFTPLEEIIGAGIGAVIPKVASRAPREGGFNVTAEARAITEGLTRGMSDAAELIKTGKTTLEVLFGKGREGAVRESDVTPRSVIDFFGEIHGALKAPVKRAEFSRSLEKRMAWNMKQGVDVSDPLVQTRLMVEAYKDANRSIFLQDNVVVNAYNRALTALTERQRATGKPSNAGKAIATVTKVLLPIVRVPTNIVAETIQTATGLVTGSARLASIIGKETSKINPEQADLVMRELKKGSLGAAVLLVGYFNADSIGGYYQTGKKKDKKDVPYGSIRIEGVDVPSYLLHNPLTETLQLGATIRRVAESKLHKKDAEQQGIGSGTWAAALGLIEEVPFVRQQVETAKMLDSQEGPYARGEFVKSLTVPAAVDFAARKMDTNAQGETIQRKPETVLQHIETGIPVLRETVPARDAKGVIRTLPSGKKVLISPAK